MTKTCSIIECNKPHIAKGFCHSHFNRFRRYGDPLIDKTRKPKICSVEYCGLTMEGNGYCKKHYERWRKHGDPYKRLTFKSETGKCSIHKCKNIHYAKGMCREHWSLIPKLICITYYSKGKMICECCDENIFEFLTINHINNDGAEHRRQIGKTTNLYKWLIRNNFPEGFNVFCMNCNFAERFGIKCPHYRNTHIMAERNANNDIEFLTTYLKSNNLYGFKQIG